MRDLIKYAMFIWLSLARQSQNSNPFFYYFRILRAYS